MTDLTNSDPIWAYADAKKEAFAELADKVWATPELCYGEYRSVAEHTRMLREQVVPPTAGCEELEPDCPLDVVRGARRAVAARTALSTSSALIVRVKPGRTTPSTGTMRKPLPDT